MVLQEDRFAGQPPAVGGQEARQLFEALGNRLSERMEVVVRERVDQKLAPVLSKMERQMSALAKLVNTAIISSRAPRNGQVVDDEDEEDLQSQARSRVD
jgi:hypothetical protein